jgi:NitT/TauT family transport system substrate-binding protein
MKFFQRPYFQSIACALLLALSLAGCGGPATSSTDNSSGSSSSMTLKVGQITNAITFFPMYVAEQEGFFKAQGLTLDPSPPTLLNSGSRLAAAVESNSVEVGVGAVTDVYTISRVDSYIKMIGAVSTGLLLDVVASKSFEQQAHISATSSLADKVKALVGKKVGISAPNSASDALVTYLFRQQGLDDQRDVTKVNVGADTTGDLSALKSGHVDAVVVGIPGGEIAEGQGYGDIFISPTRGDDPALMGQLFSVAYARQQTIDAKPKAVQAFIRGIDQAEVFIQKQPDQALVLLKKYLPTVDAAALDSSWNATKSSMPQHAQICQRNYDVADNFHLKAGLIAVPLAYKDLVATDTINKARGSPSSC